jgi:colicin import membrane protein
MVRITIGSDGRVLSYTFVKKSSVGEFNSAVERCLKTASPLPVDRPVQVVVEFKGTGVGKLE